MVRKDTVVPKVLLEIKAIVVNEVNVVRNGEKCALSSTMYQRIGRVL